MESPVCFPRSGVCIPAVAFPPPPRGAPAALRSPGRRPRRRGDPAHPQGPALLAPPRPRRGLPLVARCVSQPAGSRGGSAGCGPLSAPLSHASRREARAGAGRRPLPLTDAPVEAPRPSAARGRHGGAEEPPAGAGAATTSRSRRRWARGPVGRGGAGAAGARDALAPAGRRRSPGLEGSGPAIPGVGGPGRPCPGRGGGRAAGFGGAVGGGGRS